MLPDAEVDAKPLLLDTKKGMSSVLLNPSL
jgi:hypothetical protein